MASHHHHHKHQDHEHHGPEQSPINADTFTDRNRQHWNQAASTYSSAEWQKDFINTTYAFILSNLDWIGVEFPDPATVFEQEGGMPSPQVRVLDYACGPGTITGAFLGRATEFVGVDVSENMVKVYNEKFAELGSEQQNCGNGTLTRTAKAFVGNLLDIKGPSESVSSAKFFDFDLAVVGYGFHHFQDVYLATSRIASRLKPGGVLMIVDFVTHAKAEGDPVKNTIAHHGFGEEEVKSIFEGAGLVDIGVMEMEEAVMMKKPGARDDEPGWERKVFLGRGRKPA